VSDYCLAQNEHFISTTSLHDHVFSTLESKYLRRWSQEYSERRCVFIFNWNLSCFQFLSTFFKLRKLKMWEMQTIKFIVPTFSLLSNFTWVENKHITESGKVGYVMLISMNRVWPISNSYTERVIFKKLYH
jgi:hypothetical protein